ncbi:MAG: tetratricopeptide repeat protein [Granulosicoccus sp.]
MIASDLLWFLLPVAAAGGWLAARQSDGGKASRFWDYSQQFHEELGQLLSEKEADQQLFDTFTHGDRDAAETHIALGNLYRRRGEFERAIRIHESIMEKPDLDAEVRALARFELASDFDGAGLLDRAEEALHGLIKSDHKRVEAYDNLLQLHERQQDWLQAIKVALQCEIDTGKDLSQSVAHYHCELADIEITSDDPAEALRLLNLALGHWSECARAHIQLAGMALKASRYPEAISHYDKVEKLEPALMPVIIEKRFAALRGAGDLQSLKEFVSRIQSQRNAYSVIRTTREVIADLVDETTADRFFKDQILKRPSLKGLRDWAHDQLALSKPGERDKVQIICNLLDQVMEDKPTYRCRSCGFQGNVMHWRCPGCACWDTVSTIIGVEGE